MAKRCERLALTAASKPRSRQPDPTPVEELAKLPGMDYKQIARMKMWYLPDGEPDVQRVQAELDSLGVMIVPNAPQFANAVQEAAFKNEQRLREQARVEMAQNTDPFYYHDECGEDLNARVLAMAEHFKKPGTISDLLRLGRNIPTTPRQVAEIISRSQKPEAKPAEKPVKKAEAVAK